MFTLLSGHPYFVGVQYHPEYISRPMNPSAPYLGLLLASSNKLQQFAARGFRRSPRMSFCESDTDSVDSLGNDSDGDEVARLTSKTSDLDLAAKGGGGGGGES
jgi:CTP synthase